jgi:hypothetical protein
LGCTLRQSQKISVAVHVGNRSGIGTAGIIGGMKSRHDGSIAAIERLLEPVSRSLNLEAAKKLIKLKADAKTQARVDELARKCNEGALTPSERSEYERYVTAGNLVAILQAKARLILSKTA